jgi:hypothetical protein
MPNPRLSLVVVRDGRPWVIDSSFRRSAAYRRHLTGLKRIPSYEQMLEHLEHLVVRLRRAATIDRTVARTPEEWLARSDEKTDAFFEHVCVQHDLRRSIGYAARFLNTTALYVIGPPHQQELARRASRAIGRLICPPSWRPRGPKRRPVVSASVHATRSALLQKVRQIWKADDDGTERRTELVRHLAALGWQFPSVPVTVGRLPPTRVVDFLISRHAGVGQKRLRRAASAANVELIYQ